MDKEEFISAVRQAENMLYHVALSILKNDSDCGDAVQEALMKAYEKLDTLKETKYFKTWLTRILIYECYKIRKKSQRFISYEEYAAKEQGKEDHMYTDLYQAISELPEDLRISVTLFYIEGFSVLEISEILGCVESTVKSRLYRARHQLRRMLEDKEEVLC